MFITEGKIGGSIVASTAADNLLFGGTGVFATDVALGAGTILAAPEILTVAAFAAALTTFGFFGGGQLGAFAFNVPQMSENMEGKVNKWYQSFNN